MHKSTAIFFIFLLSFNTINSMKTLSIEAMLPTKDIHNKLMDMLVEIQTQNTPRTVKELSNAILDLLKHLKNDQANHEEINTKMMTQCIEEENFRRKEVTDAQSAYNASSSAFAKCQASLHSAENNLPALKSALTEFKANLDAKTLERKKQIELYNRRRADWTEAINFVTEFIVQVSNKLSKFTSFTELGEKLISHMSKIGRMSEAFSVLISLSEDAKVLADDPGAHSNYSYRSQVKTISKLKDNLRSLLNKLVIDSKTNDGDEDKAQAAYEKLKAELIKLIDELNENIASTNAQIVSMRNCSSAETKIMTVANNKLNRNSRLLHLSGQTCTDFTKEFIHATKNRLGEMDVINQIIRIMNKRFGEIPKDLINYLNSIRSQFNQYVNSTRFIKLQEYVQTHIADNAHGAALSK